jgi:hypothetical protein
VVEPGLTGINTRLGARAIKPVAELIPNNLMKAISYDIPVSLIAAFPKRKLIIRAEDEADIIANVTGKDLERISFIKLLALNGEIGSLILWGHGIPVELVVSDPCRDLPLLYRYAPLLAGRPVRVSVPLVAGIGNVVKLAGALNFAVKLEGGQPDALALEELHRIAHFYLHQSMVSEPIEFIHSLFLSFYRRDPVTLWNIQEEDSAFTRYINERGEETMPGRLAGMDVNEDFSTFIQEILKGLAAEKGECIECEFLMCCQGYFKWPRSEYCCDGVKALMSTLRSAAEELRADIASLQSSEKDGPP